VGVEARSEEWERGAANLRGGVPYNTETNFNYASYEESREQEVVRQKVLGRI
jgi:hypothetical protein